ncbi:hypothetical protein MIMGU_mgv1a023225mg [Erythranthe guttata]|uniref:Peroxisomal membrane protein 11A n=1 Tax=Erythranthe guttata TaxID=4155 RepID=A0A022RYP2_ERYGU|nr:hypothetical protein MIMGU_mgv1a023225mg [Erythranthe guttata]
MDSKPPPADPPPQNSTSPAKSKDFLTHLEIYLAKRDGVDKLLKISRYATKIVIASAVLDHSPPLTARLKSFESSVGVSRKAFRLGKFIQDGLYFFLEQFVWLGKSGLIDKRHLPALQKLSAWFEFIGYFGSVSLKVIELRKIDEEERCLASTVDLTLLRGINGGDEMEKLRKLKEKKTMKRLSVVQDLADGLMAFADIRDGGGSLSSPLVLSSAGMLSAVISTHKNWISC